MIYMIKRGNLLVPIDPPNHGLDKSRMDKFSQLHQFLFQTRVRHFEGVDTFSKSPKWWSCWRCLTQYVA